MPTKKSTTQPQPVHLQPQPDPVGPEQQAGTTTTTPTTAKPRTKRKPPAEPPIPIDPARLAQLRQLAFICHSSAEDSIYESDATFSWADAEAGGISVYGALPSYLGEVNAEAFQPWAVEVAIRGARQHQVWRTIMAEHSTAIKTAIRCSVDNFANDARDYSVAYEDLFSEVSYLIFKMAHKFAKPSSTAKLSTRLVGLAKRHVRFYHNNKNLTRHRAIRRRLESGKPICIEIESEEQQAANRALDKIAKSRLKAA
jgi:hypothetical protein